MVVTNQSSRLNEKHQIVDCLLMTDFYAPNFGKAEGAYCFQLVRQSVRASVAKFIKIQSYMDSSSKN